MNGYFSYLAAVPQWIWITVMFIYGAIVGSFLNVVIHRVPRDEEIVRTPSHCPHCGEGIKWYLNVPIASWLFLGGKAACCKARLKFRYPLVELIVASLTAYEFHRFGLTLEFLSAWLFTCLLIALIFIDWEHMRLPNILTLPGTVIGLLFALGGVGPDIVDALIGVVVGAGGFFGIMALYKLARGVEGMGMGDVKLMAMIGAFLGWQLTLLVVIFGSLLGLFYGVYAMLKSGRGGQTAIPFGVFLGIAAIVVLLWGQPLLEWYINLYPRFD